MNKLYDDFKSGIKPKTQERYKAFLREIEDTAKLYVKIIAPQRSHFENKKEYFGMLAELISATDHASKEEMLAFINKEVENLNKKASSHKQTKTQKENEVIIERIADALATAEKPMRVAEIMACEGCGYSSQKICALLKVMGERVTRTEEKGVAYFALAE